MEPLINDVTFNFPIRGKSRSKTKRSIVTSQGDEPTIPTKYAKLTPKSVKKVEISNSRNSKGEAWTMIDG